MEIKLLALDLDGTVLRSDNTLSESMRGALMKAVDGGLKVTNGPLQVGGTALEVGGDTFVPTNVTIGGNSYTILAKQ